MRDKSEEFLDKYGVWIIMIFLFICMWGFAETIRSQYPCKPTVIDYHTSE